VLSWVDLPSSSSVGAALQNRSSAAATSGQTTFAITYTAPYVDVFKNGVRLSPGTDYTATNGTSIVLATGAILGDLIECVGYNTLIAGTINYNDLYNKPTLFSGSYADLTNKPTIDTLVPSQTGNSGKYLTTNGTTVSWATVSGGGGSSAYSNQYSINGTTTDATETEIFIGGTANTRIAVPTNKNVYYTVDIIARETGGGTNYGAFTLKSVAANSSTGVVSDLGNMYEVIIARSSVNIAVDIRADNTNKTINLYVTGLAGVTLSWKAVVTTVEV
jgi:hypothetical protein